MTLDVTSELVLILLVSVGAHITVAWTAIAWQARRERSRYIERLESVVLPAAETRLAAAVESKLIAQGPEVAKRVWEHYAGWLGRQRAEVAQAIGAAGGDEATELAALEGVVGKKNAMLLAVLEKRLRARRAGGSSAPLAAAPAAVGATGPTPTLKPEVVAALEAAGFRRADSLKTPETVS